jgi:hypothetical protein
MTNMKLAVKGTTLTITVDLSERHGKSKSGKTTMIASSGGNVAVPDSVAIVGLNIYTKEE